MESLCCPICEGDEKFCSTIGCASKVKIEIDIKVGDIVEAKPGSALVCGSGRYPSAIVVSVEPFVMVSEGADMRWSCFPIEDVKFIGNASIEVLKKCMTRL